MTSTSPQTALNAALATYDAPAVRTALAAGADPNAADDKGWVPLRQVLEGGWADKVVERFTKMPRVHPPTGTPAYDAMEQRRLATLKQVRARMHRQRHHLLGLLIEAGADVHARWESKIPSGFTPAATEAVWDEYRQYQTEVVGAVIPTVAASLARLQPWIERVSQWPAQNNWGARGSFLDDVDFAVYLEANNEGPRCHPTAQVFIESFIVAVVEHRPDMAQQWRADQALSDNQDVPFLEHLLPDHTLTTLIEEGEHRRLARTRQAALQVRPATVSARPRRRS